MHGFLYPPVSGDYTFWISSDDASELWLSTDDNPANKALIAFETTWSQSRVPPMYGRICWGSMPHCGHASNLSLKREMSVPSTR
ncbi:MAG: PA14 domain-containing protein [Planctomycetota bacterium]